MSTARRRIAEVTATVLAGFVGAQSCLSSPPVRNEDTVPAPPVTWSEQGAAMAAALEAEPSPTAPTAPTTPVVETWARHRLGYTALTYELPAAPEVLHVAGDRDLEVARAQGQRGRLRFEVRSFRHDETSLVQADELLARAITRTVHDAGGVVRSQSAANAGAYPGVLLGYELPARHMSLRARCVVGRARAYVAMVMFPDASLGALGRDVDRFLGALALDAGDEPEPDGDGAMGAPRYVEPVGASFAAQMPCRPRRVQGAFATPAGDRPSMTYLCEGRGAERWQVSVTSFDASPPENIFDLGAAALRADGWTVREQAWVTNRGHSGRATVLQARDGSTTTRDQLFVARGAVYELRVTLPTGEDAAQRAQITSFFDSLRIL